jgi:hypothetical protein
MSKMKNRPVFMCKRCGKALIVADLHTTRPDEDGTLLFELMKGLKDIAYCKQCLNKRQWYINQNRVADWEAGRP